MECFKHYESLKIKHNTHTNRVKVKRMAKPKERAPARHTVKIFSEHRPSAA